jgi:hypothetical protein
VSSVFRTADNGAKVEISTFLFEDKPFTAMGSVVDHENGIVVGYPNGEKLQTCDGKVIGTCQIVSTFRMTRWSFVGGWYMQCYRAVVDGKNYYGRGFGDGMLLRLRCSRSSRKKEGTS